MKDGEGSICIFGAGAIGGLLAARLSAAGVRVHLVARGATLDRIRSGGGIQFTDRSGSRIVPVEATEDASSLGPQKILFIAVKAPALLGALPRLKPLIGPDTIIVPMMNGLPWWYFDDGQSQGGADRLSVVDPSAQLRATLDPRQVIGAVLYLFVRSDAVGSVVHEMGNRIVLGATCPQGLERLDPVVEVLAASSFSVKPTTDIRRTLWTKLIANAIINPLSALTESSCGPIANHQRLEPLIQSLLAEASAVARSVGVDVDLKLEALIEGYRAIGGFKSSMLQDWEKGRALELDALLGGLCRLAELANVPIPALSAILGLLEVKTSVRAIADTTPFKT